MLKCCICKRKTNTKKLVDLITLTPGESKPYRVDESNVILCSDCKRKLWWKPAAAGDKWVIKKLEH